MINSNIATGTSIRRIKAPKEWSPEGHTTKVVREGSPDAGYFGTDGIFSFLIRTEWELAEEPA